MRIVHILTRLLRAGSEENTLLTAAGQIALGHEVYILHGREVMADHALRVAPGAKLIEASSLVHAIRPARDAVAFVEVLRALRDLRPDVVHTHQSKAGIVGRFAAAAAAVPLIVHGVHILPFLGVGPLKRRFYIAAEQAASIVTHGFIHVSEGMQHACLLHRVGVGRSHHVVRSGFDLGRFAEADPPADWHTLADSHVPNEKPVIIAMLAALEPRKRHLELLQQGAGYLRSRPQVRLLLAGEGALGEQTATLIRNLGLERQVKLLGYRSDPERIIAGADICIHCSEREGLPRTVLQYLTAGRPVILFDLPGIEEIITNDINGVIVEQGNWAGFFGSVDKLVLNADARATLAVAAKRTKLDQWDATQMGERTLAVYRELQDRRDLAPVHT